MTPRGHIIIRLEDKVRIGPITTITLIAVISMAVLAVLAASTAHATSAISQRQADGVQMLYLDECAGQEFVAGIDDTLSNVRKAGGSEAEGVRAITERLDQICERARGAGGNHVQCTANVDGSSVRAEFVCEQARQLNIAITIQDDATFRITEWKMASAQQEQPTAGALWQG